MPFNRQNMARVASASTGAQANWLYRTTDTFIEILAPGYFNDGYTNFKVDDVIQIKDADRYDYVSIISSSVFGVAVEPVSFASAGPVEVLNAFDLTTQFFTGLDTVIDVSFGDDQGVPSDSVVLTGGVFIFNQPGTYTLRLRLSVNRLSNPGSTIFVARLLLNDVQVGNPVAIIMTDNDTTIPMFTTFTADFLIGDEVKIEAYLDSVGNDDGDLLAVTSTIGWGVSPSASMRILKY